MSKKLYCNLTVCIACRSCDLACAVQRNKSQALLQTFQEQPELKYRVVIRAPEDIKIPFPCQECQDKPCLKACEPKALSYHNENQLLKLDAERCIEGCWQCIKVCPSAAIVFDREMEPALQCDLCPAYETKPCLWACPCKALFFCEFEEYLQELQNLRDDGDFQDYCFRLGS